jgi:hypothetical protein
MKPSRIAGSLLLCFFIAAFAPSVRSAQPFSSGQLSFAVDVDGERSAYSNFFAPVLPGENIELRIVDAADGEFAIDSEAGHVVAAGAGTWQWRAPKTVGVYPLRIVRKAGGESMTLRLFVQAPISAIKRGRLNGYRMDNYPKPLQGQPMYEPPVGFIEVTQANENTPLSPHFTLKQFLCKQEGGYPKYVALQPRLLLKLEAVLQAVNARGIRADSFFVMSGYRTPYYNHTLDNVPYSRHVWGDAADVFVDAKPRDGRMDDLNGDGKVNRADAAHLYKIADEVSRNAQPQLVGGVGEYDSTAAHGPFVHIDARGSQARWGHASR